MIKGKNFVGARASIRNALALGPELDGARDMLAQIEEKAVEQEAQHTLGPKIEEAKKGIEKAQMRVKGKRFIDADMALDTVISELNSIPEEMQKYVAAEATRRSAELSR